MIDMSVENKVVNGIGWQMLERICSALIQFLLSVVLARLVLPKEYGIVSLIMVFITISDLLVNSGLGTALIQRKEIDEKDIDSVFTYTTCVSIGLWLLLYILAPYIATFYNEQLIVPALRAYGLVIWPSAIMGLLRSILMKKMDFKKVFFSSIIPLLISGIVGVVIALMGGGVYALIGQALVYAIGGTIFLTFITRWRPHIKLYKDRIAGLWKFGWKLMVANLIDVGYRNVYTLCVPKFFGNELLGYYSNGRQIPNVLVSTINASVVSALYPVFAKQQDNINELKKSLRVTLRMSNIIIFPIMGGIFVLAKPIVLILFGEKWLDAAWYLCFFCVTHALQHVQSISFHAISACGHSGIYMRYEILKKSIGLLVLFVSLPLGISALMWGQVIVAILYIIINIYPNRKWLSYSIYEQCRDIIPYILITLLMCLGVFLIGEIFIIEKMFYLKLVIQVSCGIILYYMMAKLFKLQELNMIIMMIKNKIIKK